MLAGRLAGNTTPLLRFLTVFAAMAFAPSLFAQGLPLTISNSFNPSTVSVGTATTTMTVTVTNPNGFSVSGISFSDTYPGGLVPDQIGAYTCNAGIAAFTGSGWSLGNVTLAAGASCSVPVLMHATISGQITNTTSQVTGTGVPPGAAASATLNVLATIVAPVTAAPMLERWAMLLLGVLLLGAVVAAPVRRVRPSGFE